MELIVSDRQQAPRSAPPAARSQAGLVIALRGVLRLAQARLDELAHDAKDRLVAPVEVDGQEDRQLGHPAVRARTNGGEVTRGGRKVATTREFEQVLESQQVPSAGPRNADKRWRRFPQALSRRMT
jgi:hypothetical protein